ncbi:MAG: hypothetical protein JXR53_08585, partial [Bacteroidales bacterium]|nr:hypothetical protein [Bacteroidales bacterium]
MSANSIYGFGCGCDLTECYVKPQPLSLRHTHATRNLTQFNVKRHPHYSNASQNTNAIGYAEQLPIAIGVQYLPFGEIFVNQQNSTYDTRYKFSAKLKRSGNPAT